MLQSYFWRKHVQTPDYKKYYFQQDGATAHTADIVQDFEKICQQENVAATLTWSKPMWFLSIGSSQVGCV